MDCCKKNHNHQDEHQGEGKHKGHSPWMMTLCCLIPILLAAFLLSRGVSLGYMFLLICPILHIGMIWFMMKNTTIGKREATESE